MSYFKEGDRVRIIENSRYYGISETNPAKDVGTIQSISVCEDLTLPIRVKWDSGSFNTYADEDLELVPEKPEEVSPFDTQEGGEHYKTAIQPIEYIQANNLGYLEGNVIKYVSRYKEKNGIEDLKKARHYIDFLIHYAEKEGEL